MVYIRHRIEGCNDDSSRTLIMKYVTVCLRCVKNCVPSAKIKWHYYAARIVKQRNKCSIDDLKNVFKLSSEKTDPNIANTTTQFKQIFIRFYEVSNCHKYHYVKIVLTFNLRPWVKIRHDDIKNVFPKLKITMFRRFSKRLEFFLLICWSFFKTDFCWQEKYLGLQSLQMSVVIDHRYIIRPSRPSSSKLVTFLVKIVPNIEHFFNVKFVMRGLILQKGLPYVLLQSRVGVIDFVTTDAYLKYVIIEETKEDQILDQSFMFKKWVLWITS